MATLKRLVVRGQGIAARTRSGAAGARALAARGRLLASDLLAFALPQRCPGCGVPAAHATSVCADCRARIPLLSTALCARCLARGREPVGCVSHPRFQVWVAWVYEERSACLVHALKYQERVGLAPSLAGELDRALPASLPLDLVLEVPLHRARRRERGYNQAALLADALAVLRSAPRLTDALTRIRATAPQARLEPGARRRNVDGAFRVNRPHSLKGRHVTIVDDVITTGATMEACLAALDRAGAEATGVALAWAQ